MAGSERGYHERIAILSVTRITNLMCKQKRLSRKDCNMCSITTGVELWSEIDDKPLSRCGSWRYTRIPACRMDLATAPWCRVSEQTSDQAYAPGVEGKRLMSCALYITEQPNVQVSRAANYYPSRHTLCRPRQSYETGIEQESI